MRAHFYRCYFVSNFVANMFELVLQYYERFLRVVHLYVIFYTIY